LPTSSIIGLVDTFTEAPAFSAKTNDLVLITNEREAIAAWARMRPLPRPARPFTNGPRR